MLDVSFNFVKQGVKVASVVGIVYSIYKWVKPSPVEAEDYLGFLNDFDKFDIDDVTIAFENQSKKWRRRFNKLKELGKIIIPPLAGVYRWVTSNRKGNDQNDQWDFESLKESLRKIDPLDFELDLDDLDSFR